MEISEKRDRRRVIICLTFVFGVLIITSLINPVKNYFSKKEEVEIVHNFVRQFIFSDDERAYSVLREYFDSTPKDVYSHSIDL